jgi:competence protein ComFC
MRMSILRIIHNLSTFFLHTLDFIFPKSKKVQILESFSISEWNNLSRPGIHENIHFFFPYENKNVRQAIWEIKYKRNKTLKGSLLHAVYENILPEIEEKITFENFNAPIITWVPQSRKRKKERGYNQSKDLAEALAKKLNLTTENLLYKTKETESQTKLKRTRRLLNMKNSFAVMEEKNAKESICGKNIIIIDDVVTTGATLNEARKVLTQAGARKVMCIALAH